MKTALRISAPLGEAIAELMLAAREPNSRMCILVDSVLHFRDEILPVITSVINTKGVGEGNTVKFQVGQTRLLWENGSTAYVMTQAMPERLRGHRIKLAWFVGGPRKGLMDDVLHCRYNDKLMRLVIS